MRLLKLLLLLPIFSVTVIEPSPAAASSAVRGVRFKADKRAYPEGAPVRLTVVNDSGAPIALPGCASFVVEAFQEDGFKVIEQRRCESEGEALLIAPGAKGSKTFEFDPLHETQQIMRAYVTFGVGCSKGFPLSSASCDAFYTAYTDSFLILKPSE